MSLQEATQLRPARTPEVFTKARRSRALPSVPVGVVALFVVAYAGYALLGYFTVLRWHIVVGDAVSRLAHAFFVWHNQPPKLAAIGFVWPPLMTLVLLPLAALRSAAASLAALPLTSAFFGAALVLTLERTLALLAMPLRLRLPLVALVAVNPMILFYAANGMSESVYLFFLVFAVFTFIRWYLLSTPSALVLCSFTLAFAVLTRYEILAWVAVLAVAVVATLVRRRETRDAVEGSTIAFLAPIVYTFGLWIFFNWLILGNPLYWLRSEVTQTFVETQAATGTQIGLGAALRDTASLTWHLYPATIVMVGVLAAVAFWRRDLISLVLAVAIVLNPILTAFLAAYSDTSVVLQLRYNLRPIPLALCGVAWLWREAPGRGPKLAVWLTAVALMAGSLPSTWRMMETYRQQSQEQAFTRALRTGHDQEGTRSLGTGVRVGNAPERAAARWISGHVSGSNAILADDAEAFAVMLYTGRPGMFLDRIDFGDPYWLDVLDSPFGRVRYFLVPRRHVDRIQARYPAVLRGGVAFLRPVYRNARWALFRVAPPRRPR